MTILYQLGSGTVNVAQLHALLRESYWAKDRPISAVAKSIRHAFCISAWDGERMIGFARLITDFTTHAYLADVIVAPEQRGHGIGRTMVSKLVDHESVATCKISLHTRDAYEVYRPLGFYDSPSMRRKPRQSWTQVQP